MGTVLSFNILSILFKNDEGIDINIVKAWIDYILICANLTRWIRDQQESEGVPVGEDVYIILRLDGRVRRSGKVSTISEKICFTFVPIHVELSFISLLNVNKNYDHHQTRITQLVF
jgi:hypothetical protein